MAEKAVRAEDAYLPSAAFPVCLLPFPGVFQAHARLTADPLAFLPLRCLPHCPRVQAAQEMLLFSGVFMKENSAMGPPYLHKVLPCSRLSFSCSGVCCITFLKHILSCVTLITAFQL